MESIADSSEEFEYSKPIYKDGRFDNPWDTWRTWTFTKLFHFLFIAKNHSAIPKSKTLDETLPVLAPDFSEFSKAPDSGVRHMWIGHASSLIQMDGIIFLTDPIFSDRCSPVQFAGGAKRYRPPPCTVEELPTVDCVVISHNHYDHLDVNSVAALNKRFGDKLKWFVPSGMKQWMNSQGCNNVSEQTWWEKGKFSGPNGTITFACTPCQHWSKRTILDTNKVLWSSWSVIGPKHKFYFAGDTGYCEAFKQIGRKYGPFDLATIPIGAYSPRDFLSPQHVDPSQAVDIHVDIRSKKSVGIHWGTFTLGREFYLEPRIKIREELDRRGMDPSSFVTPAHGEIRTF